MNRIYKYFVVWNLQYGVFSAGEMCHFRRDFKYCLLGCCADGCCNVDWVVWMIGGGVMGGLLLISVIVCLVCACMKKKSKRGRVVQPHCSSLPPPPYSAAVATMPYPQDIGVGVHPLQPTHFLPPTAPPPSAPPPVCPSPYRDMYEEEQPPPLPAGLNSQEPHRRDI